MNKESFKYGIGFWIGGGVYSLINMIMNLRKADQNDILLYNYLITGVAILGLIFNIISLNKSKNSFNIFSRFWLISMQPNELWQNQTNEYIVEPIIKRSH